MSDFRIRNAGKKIAKFTPNREGPYSNQRTFDHPLAVGASDKHFVTPESEMAIRNQDILDLGSLAVARAKLAAKIKREQGLSLTEALVQARSEIKTIEDIESK